MTGRGHEGTFSGDGNKLYLDWGVGHSGYTFVKTYQIIKYLCISLCKLYLNFLENEKIRGN